MRLVIVLAISICCLICSMYPVVFNTSDYTTVSDFSSIKNSTYVYPTVEEVELAVKNYESSHSYIMNVYDCSEMSQDFWDICYANGWHAVIGWRILNRNMAHCWVAIEIAPGAWVCADPTCGNIIPIDSDYNIKFNGVSRSVESTWFYTASWFETPNEFREFLRTTGFY